MEQHSIDTLKEAIEQAVGCKIKTPKDFDYLAECIFDKVHERISPTTLKRIWGYITDAGATPRKSTLDILARFLNYPDWAAFCSAYPSPLPDYTSTAQDASPSASEVPAPKQSFHHHFSSRSSGLVVAFLVLALLISIPFAIRSLRSPSPHVIVRKGQTFSSYEEYQKLFGITYDPRHTYFVRLPGMPHIALWAPEYHHPTWHNEGDSAAMMPTITEYYHPADWPTDSASLATLARINKERYVKAVEENEVRLVFMKNLIDTSFIFLGVYNLSYSKSDSTHIVFSRLADEATDDLESLNLFRH